jgi:hypothetical protein
MATTVTVCKVDLVDVIFTEVSQSGSKQSFLNTASALTVPESIDVEHQIKQAGAKGTDRHIITYKLGDVDATTGQFSQLSLSLTLNIPRAAGITAAKVKDAAKVLQCFLKQTEIANIMSGVTPSGDISVASFVPN